MNIKERFLSLTKKTYPHGKEQELFHLLPSFPQDEFGNLYTKIGESDVMFTSHLDTATSAYTEVNHVIEGDIIKTDGKSILGADDKAGVTIMLHMIENKIPGLYYFFLGEEVGCVGSKKLSEQQKVEKLPYINKVISFDRRDTDSIITFQAGSRCCSDKFGNELSKMLNDVEPTFKYKNDPTGIYTDSAQFVKIYPECTNISVGYYSEHTFSERQDIEHLRKLAEACIKIDWNSLPVERDMTKTEYSYGGYGIYGSGYGGGYSSWDEQYWGTGNYSSERANYKPITKTDKVYFWDEEYRYVSSLEINKNTGQLISLDIDPERIYTERMAIYSFLEDIELLYDSMSWNGLNLRLRYFDGRVTDVTRQEMEEYIDELDLSDLVYTNDDYKSQNSDGLFSD